MKDLKEVASKLDQLQGKLKLLEDGYIPINHKKFQSVLRETLKDLFRDEEKISLLREIKMIGISFGMIGVLLVLFVIALLLFTTPI